MVVKVVVMLVDLVMVKTLVMLVKVVIMLIAGGQGRDHAGGPGGGQDGGHGGQGRDRAGGRGGGPRSGRRRQLGPGHRRRQGRCC